MVRGVAIAHSCLVAVKNSLWTLGYQSNGYRSKLIIFVKSKSFKTLFPITRHPMNIGDKVPDLLGLDQDGKEVRLSDYPGKRIVLYFYPKDNTSGCTAQACSLRDSYTELREAGYEIIGVSKDSARSHQGFIKKQSLPFRLIADTDTILNQAFGVWVEKSMYGRKYMGTERTTFVIDADATIVRILRGREVSTAQHAEQILSETNK